MRVVNAPGRFDRSPRSLATDVRRWTELDGVSAVFFTEVNNRDRAAVLHADGWRTTHIGVQPGAGECAIMTRNAARKVIDVHSVKLTDGGGRGRLSKPIYAPIVITKAPSGRVTLLTTSHLPAHLEGIWAVLPGRTRVRVLLKRPGLSKTIRLWLEAARAWRDRVTHLAAEHHVDDVIVAADWNLDADKAWVQDLFHHLWPGLDVVSTKAPDLGSRNVGWLATNMRPGESKVHKAASSDHDAGEFQLAHINGIANTADPMKRRAMRPDPFERVVYNGALMDQKTKTFVQVLEKRLKYALTIAQGCYNAGGVAASAGTHDGGGVIDLAAFDWEHKVHAVRAEGGFGWHRTTLPGVWSEHIHFGIRNHGRLSPSAARQQDDYDAHPPRDGLASHSLDPSWHPSPPAAFNYVDAWRELNS